MSEPLAATLLSGAVLAMLWAARSAAAAARWLLPGRAARRDWRWSGPSTWRSPSCSAVVVFAARGAGTTGARPRPGGDPARRRSRRGRRALDDPQRGRARPLRADLDRRRPGPLRRHLPALRTATRKRSAPRCVARHPELFAPELPRGRLRLEQILARARRRSAIPDLETDQALSRMGREQLWDDISEEPLEYAGFVATKVGRIWSHGPRDVMREPVWEALHWALVALRPARPRPCSPGGGAGRRCCSARSSSRSPRSAPCWSPRRGGCW